MSSTSNINPESAFYFSVPYAGHSACKSEEYETEKLPNSFVEKFSRAIQRAAPYKTRQRALWREQSGKANAAKSSSRVKFCAIPKFPVAGSSRGTKVKSRN